MTRQATETDPLLQLPPVRELIEQGARRGELSYAAINRLLSELPADLAVDDAQVELLLEAIEDRGIAVIDEPDVAPDAAVTDDLAGDSVVADDDLSDDIVADAVSPGAVLAAAAPDTGARTLVNRGAAAPADAMLAAVPLRRGKHADLDEALASLEQLLVSTGAAPPPRPARGDGHGTTRGAAAAGTTGQAPPAEEEEEEEEGRVVEDAFQQYLNQMGRVPLLTAAEEVRLARLARDGSESERIAARQQLVEANLRLVVFLARRYSGRTTLPLLDIVQEGNIGLMRAVERFDPERGHRLSTYATWWIRQSINRAMTEHMRSMRLPGHLSSAIQTVYRLQRELTQSLGRQPSRQELAEAGRMTVSQVDEAMRAVSRPISLETPMGEENDMELGESLSDPEADTPVTAFSRTELREEIDRALQGLSERERVVVMKRFGIGDYSANGPASLEDVAAQMRLSRERVRQLEIRALRKLRRRSRVASFGDFFQSEDEV